MKICHDLAGMAGTINNCLSFSNSNELIKNQATQLLDSSSEKLLNYLKFYRYIYSISTHIEPANLDSFKELLSNRFKEHIININFDLSIENHTVSEELAKLFMCIIFNVAKAFYKKAKLDINIQDIENGYLIKVINISDQFNAQSLNTYPDKLDFNELDTYNVHEFFTKLLIEKIGYTLTIKQSDNSIEYYLSQ